MVLKESLKNIASEEVKSIAKRLLCTPPPVFCPSFLSLCWFEPGTTAKMVAVAIVLRSGIGYEDFLIRVMEGGGELKRKAQWPKPLVDLDMLHRK